MTRQELEMAFAPESMYVFYDPDRGYCINTELALKLLEEYLEGKAPEDQDNG